MTDTLTPVIIDTHRGRVYAAESVDGAWRYRQTTGRYEVTHAATRRRFWARDLRGARRATADITLVSALLANPPAGKPLSKGEFTAICGELSAADMRRMILAAASLAPGVTAAGLERVHADGIPVAELYPVALVNALGAVYGAAPSTWLHALRIVRPDLVPARHQS